MHHFLLVLILFSGIVLAGVMLDAEAANKAKRFVDHGTDFTPVNRAETELLDCQYGDVHDQVPTFPSGLCFNVHGEMPLPEFLYVKWRDRTTGTVYEERVDLKSRLPSPRKMHRATVHWLIEDNQLYVYLIPDGGDQFTPRNLRPADKPPNGPFKTDHLDVKTLYPDNAPPRVHGATPQKLATTERWRAEVAAQKAAQEAARREAAERGECVFIDEVLGICKPDKQRRQKP